jgi:predicted CoA-binding protein
MDYQNPEIIEKIIKDFKTIAVVGLSDKPDRPSYGVAAYLQSKGYRIIPVNPHITEVLGEKSYPDLKSIPDDIDVVDIFRRSEDVPPIVDEAIEIGAKAVWMQEGVIDENAALKASENGLQVVMNRCMLKEHLVYGI